jgi:hemin uptake protein HemP
MSTPPAQPPSLPVPKRSSGTQPRAVDSQSLFGNSAVLLIHHQGETYRLQMTRQGKLILTK